MKRDNWPVEDFGIRPAGSPDHCFYCGVERGGEHKDTCVIRQRTVVIQMTVEYVIRVPEFWTPKDIERHRNGGTWCSFNGLVELDELEERTGDCFCSRTKYKYIKEAGSLEEDLDDISVMESES